MRVMGWLKKKVVGMFFLCRIITTGSAAGPQSLKQVILRDWSKTSIIGRVDWRGLLFMQHVVVY